MEAPRQGIFGQRPIVLIAAFPVSGHSSGLIQIAAHLVKRGFKTFFIGGVQFYDEIARAGCTHVKIDLSTWRTPAIIQEQFLRPAGPARHAYHFKHFFLDAMPTAFALLKTTLEAIHDEYPDHQVRILHGSTYLGVLPFLFGVPPPRGYTTFPQVINFQPSVNAMSSVDLPPFGPGHMPDPSDEGRRRARALAELQQPMWQDVNDYGNKVLTSLGAHGRLEGTLWDTILGSYGLCLLAHSASIEYPRSDLHTSIRYIGGLPPTAFVEFDFPSWWPDVVQNGTSSILRKKVIFVSQGSNWRSLDHLVVPALKALAKRKDVLLVANLGKHGAVLPEDVKLPDNARVIDYLPYDVLLPYVDVFVFSAGYGALMHAIMNAVPVVLAGEGATKTEIAARGEWAGLGVNLKTGAPTEDSICAGIEAVLGNAAYKMRAVELQMENNALDPLKKIEDLLCA